MEISEFISKYNSTFSELLNQFEVTNKVGNSISYEKGIEECVNAVKNVQSANKKIIMIGNGGSAGITSHQVIDYWRNGKVRAVNFNDSSLLTCIANDFSYEEVFSKPMAAFADEGDIAFCISSSGNSKNIINGAREAAGKKCKVVTFSGFNSENPLRREGDLNFFVPSYSYGFVEILHLYIIHCILDTKLYCSDNIDIFNKNQPLK